MTEVAEKQWGILRWFRLLGGLIRLYGLFDGTQAVINSAEVRPHVSEVLAYVGAKLPYVGADAADLHAQGNRDSNDGPKDPLGVATRHHYQPTP